MILTFWAFLLFALAYIALGRITDPRAPFDAVAKSHGEVGAAFAVLAYGGELVALLIVLGGLPVLFQAVKRALPGGFRGVLGLFGVRGKWLWRLLGGAVGCALLLLGTIVGTELLLGGVPAGASQQAVAFQPLVGDLLAGLGLGAVTTLVLFLLLIAATALSAAVARSEFGPKLLAFALGMMSASALGMGVTALATIAWLVAFWADAPRVAQSSAVLGGVGLAWVVVVIAAMVVATVVAVLASRRGWRARGSGVASA